MSGGGEREDDAPFRDEDGLTVRQAALVQAMLEGVGSLERAAEIAGYSNRGNAWTAWNTPVVQEVFARRIRARLAGASGLAVSTQIELMQRAKSEKVRADVARDVLQLAGFSAQPAGPSGVQVNVQINLGEEPL